MARIDVKNKSIQAKIVYYGPGLCGKTTNLQVANKELAGGSELMSLATEGDMTIFFDFMPLNLKLRDMDVQFKLYTVPGQVRYNQTRKMVLKNVDGVVFVADSQPQMMDGNLESFDNLFSNLTELGINPDEIALILQYNKRDLPNVLSRSELDAALNKKNYPTLLASAYTGEGVVDTLKEACRQVLSRLGTQLPDTSHKPAASTSRKAESAKMPVAQPVGAAADTIRNAAPGQPIRNIKATLPSVTHPAQPPPARPIQPAPAPQAIGSAPQAAARPIQPAPTHGASTALAAQPVPIANVSNGMPANRVQPVASAEPAQPAQQGPVLEQALIEANRLIGELKTELENLRAERARQSSPDGFKQLSSQLVTKADLERLQRDLASKADLQALHDGMKRPPTNAELDAVGKSAPPFAQDIIKSIDALKHQMTLLGPSRASGAGALSKTDVDQLTNRLPNPADLKALSQNVDGLRSTLETTSQKLDQLKGPVSDAAGAKAEIKTVHTLVAELIQDVGRLAGGERTSVNPGPALASLSQRIGELPTKADLVKLREALTGQGAVDVQRGLVAELAEQVRHLKADTPRTSVTDVVPREDFAALAKRLRELPTKADLEQLRRNQPEEQAPSDIYAAINELRELIQRAPREASPEHDPDLATKADLVALAERLSDIPTKSDLEQLRQNQPAEQTPSDIHGAIAELRELIQRAPAGGSPEQNAELATKAELNAFIDLLSELPTKADLEQLRQRSAEAPPPADMRALEDILSQLPRKADLGALQARVESLSAAVMELSKQPVRGSEPVQRTSGLPVSEPQERLEARQQVSEPPQPAAADAASEEPTAADEADAQATGEASSAAPEEPVAEPTDTESAAPEQAPAEAAAEPEAAETVEASAAEAPEAGVATTEAEAAPVEAAPTDSEAAPTPAPEPEKVQTPEVDDYANDRQHQNAARVARVMMADLYLYNKEQVDEGIVNNDFYERNKEALADMRLTYESRVKEDIRSKRDYLQLAIDDFVKKKKKQLGIDG